MKKINGVSFRDYACACANLANGMPVEKICEVLGIEVPVWETTVEGWNNKMAELTHDDMAFYGAVFTNPKQGKFANVEGSAGGKEDVLAKYPEWGDTIKMGKYMEHAHKVGIDIDFEKEFGITLTQYTQLSSHWSAYYKKNVMDIHSQSPSDFSNGEWEEAHRLSDLNEAESAKWDAYYSEKFKNHSAGISDDIDF